MRAEDQQHISNDRSSLALAAACLISCKNFLRIGSTNQQTGSYLIAFAVVRAHVQMHCIYFDCAPYGKISSGRLGYSTPKYIQLGQCLEHVQIELVPFFAVAILLLVAST